MTATITKLFQPQALTTGAVTIYTATTASQDPTTVIRNGRARFTNTTSGNLTVTAYLVPYGQTAGAANSFMTAEALAANTHVDVDLPVMGAGDYFVALASGAGVTVHEMDGVIYTSP